MKKLLDILKTHVKGPVQTAKITWNQSDVCLEDDIEDLRELLETIKNKRIRIKSTNGYNHKTSGNEVPTCEDTGTQKDVPKKRGRKTKMSTVSTESKGRSNSSDSMSLNDTASSSSTRSRRAAAQAADQKLAQVSLIQLNTKLRRPTNFNEKQSKAVSSPPAKCRRTHRNQSAGSSSPQGDEVNGDIDGVTVDNMMVVDNEQLINECLVPVEKLNTPMIKSFTHPNTRSSRSLDRAADRNSKDLFNDSAPLSELNNKCANQEAPNSDPSQKTNRKKSMSKKDLDSGISSTEEELQQLMKANLPIAHSSPILLEPFDGEFKGFDDQPQNKKAERQAGLVRDNTFVVDIKTEETQVILKKTHNSENQESSCEETDTNVIKSRTKVLRKRVTQTVINVEEKENMNRNNETHIITSKPDDSPNLRSQTKVLKKEVDRFVKSNTDNVKNSEEDRESYSSPETKVRSRTKTKKKVDHSVKSNTDNKKNSEEDWDSYSSPETKVRSRTKTLRKHNDQHQELKSDNEVAGKSVRSRTKTIKKNNEKESQTDSTDDDSSNMRSRTKTIKKGTTNVANNVLDSEYLVSEFKNNPLSSKMNTKLPPSSPAPAKGELVKKRVEDFEKMQNGMEEGEEEIAVGRVTRNAIRNKVTSSAAEAPSSKQAQAMMQAPASFKKTNRKSVDKVKRNKVKEEKENVPLAKVPASAIKPPTSVERPRMTPLGINNRMIPATDSALKAQATKWTNSANRAAPVETNNGAFIHKQAAEESERKKKEEERLRRQAKEEEAKRKKEKALKATAEEARRKRVEKLQKVAATREAAEKEKERLAAKAEKEKEEKMRQIAIEKEKQKEEQLKKKHLIQQKTLEHEERRRQEEAARLAKLKEQEEEHRRILAMKEREQELLKQQKAELRLAEAEKTKLQGGKLGKIAAVNNAKLKLEQGMTPAEKTHGAQPSNCYEITPAREDRPLLPPKTENDYGIDDANSEDSSEDESQPRKMIPAWAQSKNRERLLMVNKYIPKKLWDMFMECDSCPDINQMFAGNPIKRRIRTSSAVWRTPPKYSRVAP